MSDENNKEDFFEDQEDSDLIRPTAEEWEEHQHFYDIINSFKYYKYNGFRKIEQTQHFISQMRDSQRERLVDYVEHLVRVKTCFSHNHEVIMKIIETANLEFNNFKANLAHPERLVLKQANQLDIDRINSILTQLVREWTAYGEEERQTCFSKILTALDRYFGDRKVEDKYEVSVLVPGAGLGRLPYEIASLGYSCEGNEFSMMMLIVSNFILNQIEEANIYRLYPWVSHYANNLVGESQLTSVTFPDLAIKPVRPNVRFSMVGGSFPEVYRIPKYEQSMDVVATSFFIDTAQNVLDYIETISYVLKPGGYWINFGPLLYHYAEMPEPSISISYDQLKTIIKSYGFEYIEEDTNPCYYTRNPRSMLIYQYQCVHFVTRKTLASADSITC